MIKWTSFFQNHIVSELEIAVYLEALGDLTPGQLENACRESTKTAERWPSPGDIRSAAARRTETTFLGPRRLHYLDEPQMTAEEREEALKDSAVLRKNLGTAPPNTQVEKRKRLNAGPPRFTVEEQKEVLRRKGYL
jgi:hypothetical protein